MINLAEDCSQAAKKGEKRGELHDQSMKPSPSNNITDDSSNTKEEDALESAKAEMGEVREENERLKMMLKRIEEDYQSLKFRFFGILNQDTSKKSTDSTLSHEAEEPELVSLCLGRIPSEPKKDENSGNSSKTKADEDLKSSLTLGLDSNFTLSNPSSANSLGDPKEEEAGEARSSTKAPKRNSDDEVAQQSHVKRARVCVRARCDTPTMSDGCQWRKYGQKISKGNPCPRAYYRCTVAPACPVRKQVQRCADDLSILITTYEGTHNHPLPVSATAMASTTSAAASMLLSGSSASQPGLGSHVMTGTSATELNGLSFNMYNNFGSKQLYFPNPSSTMFPTITLDLTATPSSSSTTINNRFSSTFPLTSRFPSTSLGFSSTVSNTLPTGWGTGSFSPLPAYTPQQLYQPHMENNHQSTSQQVLAETLTKAIASDPSFRTVVATALSSMIGGNANTNSGNQVMSTGGGDPKQAISSGTLHQNGKGCAPSFFNGLPSSSSSHSGTLLQPAFPFSIFDNASMSTNNKE